MWVHVWLIITNEQFEGNSLCLLLLRDKLH